MHSSTFEPHHDQPEPELYSSAQEENQLDLSSRKLTKNPMAVWKVPRFVFKKVLVLLLTILFIVIVEILAVPFLIPVYIFRRIVNAASKCFRPDLKKILTCRSSILAVDDLYTKPRASLEVELFLAIVPDTTEGQKFITEKLVELKTPDGHLVRPELTQYIYRWMGFYFWKEDEKFDISNHVHQYEGALKADVYDEFDMKAIIRELNAKPFVRERSPWEFISINNYKNDKNDPSEIPTHCVLLRVHHSLADGFSILGLVTELIASEGTLEPLRVEPFRRPFWKKVLLNLALPILGPFDMIESLIEAYDSNEWHTTGMKVSGIVQEAILNKIPIGYIKDIKNAHNVSFTSVILAGFTGGIRNFMLENKIKVPEKIHCLAPFPMPGHSGKLRNYMTIAYVTLPTGISDAGERLQTIHKHLLELRTSTAPLFFFHLLPFIGGLFPCMIKLFTQQILVTLITSNFPGPAHEVTYLGTTITDIIFGGGMLPGNIGLGITSISYNGDLRIAVRMDQSIIPEGVHVKRLMDKVAQEFDIFKKEASV